MQIKHHIKSYLSFSKKDRIGVISLLALISLAYILPRIFSKSDNKIHIKDETEVFQITNKLEKTSTTAANGAYGTKYATNAEPAYTEAYLFEFDPNTLTEEGWRELGLNSKTAKTIVNYRNKGGKFYKAEDLKKIWGMPEGFYNRVASYIIIEQKQNTYAAYTNTYEKAKEQRVLKKFDVNKADTADFISLPGIGPVLAKRIINFRNKLGGFYAISQVKETYGLPDSTFTLLQPYFEIDENSIHKISINTATKDDLKAHPYINWKLASLIVEYRNQHGAYKSIEDLKNLVLMDEALYAKLQHYFAL